MNKTIGEDIIRIVDAVKDKSAVLEGKTLLITGGCGLIGGYILDAIAFLNEKYFKDPCRVICVDNLIVGDKGRISHLLEKKYFKFINHDISKPLLLEGPIDYIIHAASIASPIFFRQYPIETIEANVLGILNLLRLAVDKRVKSFLYFSSSETYGDPLPGNVPTPETYWGNVSFTGPRSCYDESKRLSETICQAFFSKKNVPIKVVRPFNVYGPGMRLDDKRVIPDFMSNALRNEPIVLFSAGKDTRTFCYISDATEAFLKILLSEFNGEAFNVGNDQGEITMNGLAEIINEISDKKPGVMHKQSQDQYYLKDNPHRRCPDLSKIKKLIGYEPKVGLKPGLKKLMEWYKQVYF